MSITLIVIGGKKDGMEIPVSVPNFLIGRGSECRLRPQNNMVSQIHCLISIDGSKGDSPHSPMQPPRRSSQKADPLSTLAYIEDCSSATGTFVNGERIKWRRNLKVGDRIKIATLEFEVRLTAEQPVAKKQPVRKAPATVLGTVTATAAADGEVDILNWVKQEEKPRAASSKIALVEHTVPKEDPPEEQVTATAPSPPAPPVREKVIELDAIDLLLLSLIGPLTLVLLSFVPTFWIWQGCGALVLVSLTSVCVMRVAPSRSGVPPLPSESGPSDSGATPLLPSQPFKLDAMHAATGMFVALVLGLMSPALWIWQAGAVGLLAVLCLMVAIRTTRIKGDKLDTTNLSLIVAGSLLAMLIAAVSLLLSITPWMQFSGTGIVVVAVVCMLWRRQKGTVPFAGHPERSEGSGPNARKSSFVDSPAPVGSKSDRILWRLTTISILLIVFCGYLFPIPSWWPESLNLREWPAWLAWSTVQQFWAWFKLDVLRNWWYTGWFRWGMVVFWAAAIAILLLIRARRESARMNRG